MPVLLSDLREFCNEVAYKDASGPAYARERVRAINNALRRCWNAHDWTFLRRTNMLTVDPPVSGTQLTVTQDSTTITLGAAETFAAAYVTQAWGLIIDTDSDAIHELASIDDSPTNQTATLRIVGGWHAASAGPLDYTFRRWKFELPEDCLRIHYMWLVDNDYEVRYLTGDMFDKLRLSTPSTVSTPHVFTIREGRYELWPIPESRLRIHLSYKVEPPTYTTSTAPSTEVDHWDEDKKDLIEDALLVESAKYSGARAPVDLGTALHAWRATLKDYRGQDSTIGTQGGPMGSLMVRRPVVQGLRPGQSTGQIGFDG